MSATVEQQKYAVDHFVRWLAHENELGRYPSEVEIDRVIDLDGEAYVILKYKAEDDGEWLFGVCGSFIPSRVEDDNIVWSEFEKYEENTVVEKCKGYIQMFKKKRESDPVINTQMLIDQKKWQEVVDFVDKNIEKYRNPREKNGVKVCQFYDYFDFMYYSIISGERLEWLNGKELKLLSHKLFAQIELSDPKALDTAAQMLEIAPCYLPTLAERCEYFKKVGDLKNCRQALDEMYPFIWNAKDFARYMRSNAWLCIEEGDIEGAIHYLSWSVLYDDNEQSFAYVDGELNYIKHKLGFESVPRPSFAKTYQYFKEKNLKVLPTSQNRNFCMRLYDTCLRNKETSEVRVKEAKENLIAMTRVLGTSQEDVRVVEVNVLTPNWYCPSFQYGFAFQVPKSLRGVQSDNGSIFEFVSEDNKLRVSIKPFAKFENDDMFNNMVEGQFLSIDSTEYDVSAKQVSLNNGETVKKAEFIKGDNKVEVYFIKFTPNFCGQLIASMPIGDNFDNEILTILNTWEKDYKNN